MELVYFSKKNVFSFDNVMLKNYNHTQDYKLVIVHAKLQQLPKDTEHSFYLLPNTKYQKDINKINKIRLYLPSTKTHHNYTPELEKPAKRAGGPSSQSWHK